MSSFQPFLGAFIDTGTIYGSYLIVMSVATVYAIAILTAASGIGIAWLANRTQPKPSPGLWALSTVDREGRS